MADLARILIYGDPHLNSKNFGAHSDYAKESLWCYRKITQTAREQAATHLIGLGDLAYGRFHTLEYRTEVEAELQEQHDITNGNHIELKGNHDSAGYGMTEYEYYIQKKLIKESCNLSIGCVNITMVDSGMATKVVPNIGNPEETINIILAHDYFKFKDTALPDFGKFIELDSFESWYGADYLICGHIHNQYAFDGMIVKQIDNQPHGHRMLVQYPGSLPRPSYREGHMDLVGQLILLVIRDNGEMEYNVLDIELPKLEESFNLSIKEASKEAKLEKEKRVDLSDIIEQLNTHERNIGNPEDIIMAMKDIDDKYKNKAIELLKLGQS